MGMSVIVEIIADDVNAAQLCEQVFAYFVAIDEQFSTYKPTSEISRINAGTLAPNQCSPLMRHILKLCEETKRDTAGYFDIAHNGQLDPSGLVKGWAINEAARLVSKAGIHDFCISAGGDMALSGHNKDIQLWRVGIKNPFEQHQIVKHLLLTNHGVATSGTYIRGQHIYDPHLPLRACTDIASLTVIGPTIYEADRFATAAFAMGQAGVQFIESRPGLEGYMIDSNGIATFTSNFKRYIES